MARYSTYAQACAELGLSYRQLVHIIATRGVPTMPASNDRRYRLVDIQDLQHCLPEAEEATL